MGRSRQRSPSQQAIGCSTVSIPLTLGNWSLLAALFCQLILLVYHQVTTLVDLFPFNGSRNYTVKEKLLEAGVNGILMLLPPIGFGFAIQPLMTFGVVYYIVLFMIELLLWWLPYSTLPSGHWRDMYNRLLAFATLDFEKGDLLARWIETYKRLHRGTMTPLALRDDRPVPNLEHSILHAWTLITATATVVAYVR